MSSRRPLGTIRSVVVATTALLIGIALGPEIASGHVGNNVAHLWNEHIRPKADARYAPANTGPQPLPIHHVVQGRGVDATTATTVQLEQMCPEGESAAGGGIEAVPFANSTFTEGPTVVGSYIVFGENSHGWRASIRAAATNGWQASLVVSCFDLAGL